MSDRELLELAAKAAEYPVRGIAAKMVAYLPEDAPHLVIGNEQGGDSVWNPLTDDGDALRLAVKLRLRVCIRGLTIAATQFMRSDEINVHELIEESADEYAATRRAIVRAAAEIATPTAAQAATTKD